MCLTAGSKVAVARLRIVDTACVCCKSMDLVSYRQSESSDRCAVCFRIIASGTSAAKSCDAPVVLKL